MSNLYCTGPCHVYIGFYDGPVGTPSYYDWLKTDDSLEQNKRTLTLAPAAFYYLGTAERSPRIELIPEFTPVFDDGHSSKIPIDWFFEGEWATIVMEVNRWEESTYRLLAARTRAFAARQGDSINNPYRGAYPASELGSLIVARNLCYALWLRFPYQAKDNNQIRSVNIQMPPAYRFPFSFLVGPDVLDPLGTTARKIRLTWHALPHRLQDGSFLLYDHGFGDSQPPADPPVPIVTPPPPETIPTPQPEPVPTPPPDQSGSIPPPSQYLTDKLSPIRTTP